MCHIITKSKLSRNEGLTLTGDRWIVGDRSCSDSIFINGSPNICEYGAFVTTVCFLVFCIFFLSPSIFFSIHFFSQLHVSVCLENSVPPPSLTEGKCSYFCECRNTHTHTYALSIYIRSSHTCLRAHYHTLSPFLSTISHAHTNIHFLHTHILTFTLLHI